MVEIVCLSEPYLRELETKVSSIEGNKTELERTIFYPEGGGQPYDTGEISGIKVINVQKVNGHVIHELGSASPFKPGDTVKCAIDWERRYKFMRMHTAIHVIGGLMEHKHGAMFTGGQIGLEKSRFDFDMPALNRELSEQIIVESQEIIDRHLNVTAMVLSKEEALRIPNLARTEPGRQLLEKLPQVRIVEIQDFDVQMDGGTHVKNTSEIGRVSLTNFENKGSHRKRIEISLS